jgi:hypothetical protein
MSYANMDGVPTQSSGVSEVLASDWNTYVRDNFDAVKYGHLRCTSSTRPSVEAGTMVFETDTSRIIVYNGFAWVVVADLSNSASVSNVLVERGVPAGVVNAYAGASLPAGWLWCDGNEYAQSSYSALYSAISTSYNTGGETALYFRVPDLRGRVAVGKGTHADVDALTDNDGIAPANVANRSPKHSHSASTSVSIVDPGHGHTVRVSQGGGGIVDGNDGLVRSSGIQDGGFGGPINGSGTGITASASTTVGVGSGTANTMPYLVTNYIIKY